MKKILLCFIIFTLSLLTACSYTDNEPLVSEDVNESAQTPVVSVDEVNEEVLPVPEETRIWHEFKGLVVAEKEQNGVMTYSIYDEVHDFPYTLIPSYTETAFIEDFAVRDYIRFFVYDEPGKYDVIEETIQTVSSEFILVCERELAVFYAEVISVGDSGMHVKGLDISGRRYRDDEFRFHVYDNTRLIHWGSEIELSDFKAGDTVAIHFDGEISESKPAGLSDVRIVEKLNDDSEENYVWHEFEGLIVSIDEVDGVTEYMLQDSRNEIVFSFIPSDAETAYADEIQVGNHVNIYIYGEEGKYRPDDIDGKTVVADIVTVLDTFGYAFYAEIVDLGASWIQVDGLDMNSVNYRNEYVFKVYDSTIITDHYGEISIEDLNIGDTVVVYSFGSRQETEPARLTEVQRVIRINDD